MPTKIPWTDETWNVVTGCTKKSSGCKNCYTLRMAWRLLHNPNPKVSNAYQGVVEKVDGKVCWTGHVNCLSERLGQPLQWKKSRRIFLPSMGDLLHKSVPSDFIDSVLQVIHDTPQHTYQLLTKRPERMKKEIERFLARSWLPNLWLGVSVENQATADERRETFKSIPAAIKFVSYEPALEQIDWTGWEFVSQIISGGETGHGARPSHPDWHREARDFCQRNKIAYFFKSWGAWFHASQIQDQPMLDVCDRATSKHFWQDSSASFRLSGKLINNLLDGREWTEMPE